MQWDGTLKRFTFIWNDPSQTAQVINLTVYKTSSTSKDPICTTSASGYTGVLVCDISTYTGDFVAEAVRTTNTPTMLAQKTASIKQSFGDVGGGVLGLFLGALLLVFFALIGIYSPVLVVILGIASLFPLYFIGGISWEVLGAIGVLGGVFLHFMRKVQ